MKAEGDFLDDKLDEKNGFVKEYVNEKSFIEIQYSEGASLRAKHYNEKSLVIIEYAEKWIKRYYDNGNIKIEEDYFAGFNGIMKEYYENGKILFEGESKENERWNGKGKDYKFSNRDSFIYSFIDEDENTFIYEGDYL